MKTIKISIALVIALIPELASATALTKGDGRTVQTVAASAPITTSFDITLSKGVNLNYVTGAGSATFPPAVAIRTSHENSRNRFGAVSVGGSVAQCASGTTQADPTAPTTSTQNGCN